MIDKRIGHYIITHQIGAGGMGQVYKAYDAHLHRSVAIKILPTDLIQNKKNQRRFIQEARAASATNHPNICTIHAFGRQAGLFYIVMELIEGETLRDIIKKRSPLSHPEVVDLAIQICDGLSAAHAKEIIHRDIKPENIMISQNGYIKIMDFGLAKFKLFETEPGNQIIAGIKLPAPGSLNLTTLSTFMGTISYMSPEQIEHKPLDERTDIFSLGAVLYELMTGSAPFQGNDTIEIMESIIHHNPELPITTASKNARALANIVLKALAKDREARHASTKEMAFRLHQLKSPKKSDRQKKLTFLAGFGLVLLLFIFLLSQISNPSLSFLGLAVENNQLDRPSLKLIPTGISSETEEYPLFSPDGKNILYFFDKADDTLEAEFIIKSFAAGKVTRRIPACGITADWSPDGGLVVYQCFSCVKILNLANDMETQIANFGFRPRWSPNGELICLANTSPLIIGFDNAVFLYRVQDGQFWQVSPENGKNFCDPNWSPDNRWIVCAGGQGSRYEIWLIDWATGKARPLTHHEAWITNPVWCPSGAFIYFISNKNGIRDIWRVSVDPRKGIVLEEPYQLTTGLDVGTMDISPDGKKMIFTRNETRQQLWCAPLSLASDNAISKRKVVLANLSPTENINISPDGRWVAMESNKSGTRCLTLVSLSNFEETILSLEQTPFAPCWTPDGQWIVFDAGGGDNADIWRLSVNGNAAEKLIAHPGADWMPTCSPDGKQICLVSNRSGQFDLWVTNLETGDAWPVTSSPDLESRGAWSHDGTRLAFYTIAAQADTSYICIHDLTTRRTQIIYHSSMKDNHITMLDQVFWNNDDSGIYIYQGSQRQVLEITEPEHKVRVALKMPEDSAWSNIGCFYVVQDTGYFISGKKTVEIWLAEGL